jgi:replication initiation and membrane attachment protein DnaB
MFVFCEYDSDYAWFKMTGQAMHAAAYAYQEHFLTLSHFMFGGFIRLHNPLNYKFIAHDAYHLFIEGDIIRVKFDEYEYVSELLYQPNIGEITLATWRTLYNVNATCVPPMISDMEEYPCNFIDMIEYMQNKQQDAQQDINDGDDEFDFDFDELNVLDDNIGSDEDFDENDNTEYVDEFIKKEIDV